MTQFTNIAVLLAGLLLSVGCSEILTDYSFYTPDASDDGGQQLTDAGEPVDAGCAFRCDGVCTDTQTDPLHCGSCGHSCSAPDNGEATCTEGGCGFTCAPGYYEVVGTCEPRLAPRPVAPLSTATATSRRPTFRWELAARNDGARIEICADRACTSVLQTIDASGTSGRPATDLPSGVVFWRLYGRQGSDVGTATSVTWQLYIGARSADVDTSWGTTLDVNGDGFADVAVGAPSMGNPDTGWTHVYVGGAAGLQTSPQTLIGPSGGQFGRAVASAGDVNGDGFTDLIVGDPEANGLDGAVHLYLGGPGGLTTTAHQRLGPIPGFAGGEFGLSLAAVGDVNQDGFADVVVGAPSAGTAFLYLGRTDGLNPAPKILETPSGAAGGEFGWSVASAGDTDGDGFADIVVGAPRAGSNAGAAYLYFGGPEGPASLPDVTLPAPSAGLFGWSVATAGDVNGDGLADLVVGAPGESAGDGAVYIYPGSMDRLYTSGRHRLAGAASSGGFFGNAVASAGDVDGDGFADVVIGAPEPSTSSGAAHVCHGGTAGVSAVTCRALTGPGGAGGGFGGAVASAGDVDGDGFGDVIVGASGVGSLTGAAYVYSGGSSGVDSGRRETLDGPDGTGGFFGTSVATAGGVDGDSRARTAQRRAKGAGRWA